MHRPAGGIFFIVALCCGNGGLDLCNRLYFGPLLAPLRDPAGLVQFVFALDGVCL